jgi:hypothetical protein
MAENVATIYALWVCWANASSVKAFETSPTLLKLLDGALGVVVKELQESEKTRGIQGGGLAARIGRL